MMKATIFLMSFILVCLPASEAFGQFPFGRKPSQPPTNPWERRSLRDRAVRHAGPESRPFVEWANGDATALALVACSPRCAKQLVECYGRGDLEGVLRFTEILIVIAREDDSDRVCTFVMEHLAELKNRDCCDAFLASPLEYVLQLKDLSAVAEGNNSSSFAWSRVNWNKVGRELPEVLVVVAVFILVAFALRRVRRSATEDEPA
jgi:hypothetical protein